MDEIPNSGKDRRWDDYVAKWEWNETGTYQLARLFGDVVMDYVHNVETKTGKRYPEFCHGWDVDNFAFYPDRKDRCPCCALEIKGAHRYFMNAIDMEVEENKPSKVKADWSPVRLISMSQTLFDRIKDLKPVNKGVSVSDRDHGAVVQIKFNSKADAGAMYSASMDTKDVPITEEQAAYVVNQGYPDGASKIVKGKNGLPAQFEYVRCVNSRDDMVKSLKRNNHMGDTDSFESSSHAFDSGSRAYNREAAVARIEAEAPVETMDMSNVFGSEASAPVSAPKPAATPVKAAKKAPSDECPTDFGKFASTMVCFTDCAVQAECREATESKAEARAKPAAATSKASAPVMDDDDDSV
jgi:hypothetical protein